MVETINPKKAQPLNTKLKTQAPRSWTPFPSPLDPSCHPLRA